MPDCTDCRLFSLTFMLTGYALGAFLPALAGMGEFTGTTLATLLIFALPMTALASACPFVIRLLAHGDRVGSAAGAVYALSTVGSIAGVLATTYWLVPTFGTQATMRAVGACWGGKVVTQTQSLISWVTVRSSWRRTE